MKKQTKLRRLFLLTLAVSVALLIGDLKIAAADGDVDSSFVTRLIGGYESGTGVDLSEIRAVTLQPDGKMLIGGGFTSFANRLQRGVARLNADGSPDYGFNPSVNGDVRSVALQADGKILIGGNFTQVGGQARNRVARLNADGSLDAAFQNPSVGSNVYSVVAQPDGKILVGGEFDSIGGQVRARIARLNADGTLDTNFVNANLGGTVLTIAMQADGKVLVGGNNIFVTGTNTRYFGRLNADGTADTTFQGGVSNDFVYKVKVLPDGKILVGGGFGFVNSGGASFERSSLARFNADGTLDTSLGNVTEVTGSIYDFVALPNGQIIVGGSISYKNYTRKGLARLNSDGTLDQAYDPNVQGTLGQVYALVLQPDGKLLAGGNFEFIGGQARNSFVRLNADASLDLFPEDVSLNSTGSQYGWVRAITVQPDGKILVGGYFTSAGGRTRRGVVRINADGAIDTTFNDPGITDFFYTSISAIVVQPDGKILVGGDFNLVNGQTRRKLIRLNSDGSLDASFNANVSDVVYSIALQPDGKVLIGGIFYEVDGQQRSRLARLNTNGSLDASFNRGSDFAVSYSITVLADGKILASGSQSGLPGGLFRYNSNGTRDTTFNIADSGGGSVKRAYLQADGKILIIGGFYTINGQPRANIARLNANGTLDTTFQPVNFGSGTSEVNDLVVQANGKIVIVGRFPTINGQARKNLARLNTDGTLDTTFGAVVNTVGSQTVYEIAMQQDEKLIVGGDFQDINGVGVDYIARLLNGVAATCDYSINPTNGTFASAGGTGSFTVTASQGCAWTATSNNPDWVTVTSGSNGGGNGTVTYAVAANAGTASRTGTITLSGINQTVTHTVTQSGAAPVCTFTVAPLNQTFGAAGGAGTLNITAPNGCAWTAAVEAPALTGYFSVAADWITLTSPNTGSGNGTISYTVAPNDGTAMRTGRILVGGQTFTVNQAGATTTTNNLKMFDYDGDGQTDISIYRPSLGQWWYLRSSDGANRAFAFGTTAAKIVPADYTGDGKTDIAYFQPSTGEWFILRSEDNSYYGFPFGQDGDIPVAADFDSDGKADPTVFRPSTQVWYTVKSTGGNLIRQFGSPGDVPIAADYDGDKIADVAIFRPGVAEWWIQKSTGGSLVYQFGAAGDKAVPADYTGDGKTDVAFYRPSTGEWYVIRSENQSFYAAPFGQTGDIPIPGDYDKDGKADFAVFRPSNNGWYLNRSTLGPVILSFGQTGDLPTPNAFVP